MAETKTVQLADEGPGAVPVQAPTYAGEGPGCDACGATMQPMGHCKYLCRCCGFLRTCIDTV